VKLTGIRKFVAATLAVVACFMSPASVLADLSLTDSFDSLSISDYYADYSSVNFVTAKGNPIKVYIEGTALGVENTSGTSVKITVFDNNNNVVSTNSNNVSFTIDIADNIKPGVLYYLDMKYTEGDVQSIQELALTRKDSGDLTFVNSTSYDFNVERCSELWTDEQSLSECLEPQNDVECDAPQIVQTAARLTEGLTSDWDKCLAIYTYMTTQFAYDYIQVDDDYYVYQDDAKSLIRRKIAICEGLGNTFVALCRAAGVPAAVSFGIGGDTTELVLADDYINDESPNHAWACVCLDGTWYHVDPTWDGGNSYEGNSFGTGHITYGSSGYNFYLMPLESFSLTHKICDADTRHGIESSGVCGESATYEISRDGTITITGSGKLELPEGLNGFWNVVFDEDCTIDIIGKNCFSDCDIITSVILPDTVTEIRAGAFETCEDLEYIYLPEGLVSIGDGAFDYCDELSYVYIPDSVTSVGEWAFDDCPRAIISKPEGLDINEDNYYVNPYMIIDRE